MRRKLKFTACSLLVASALLSGCNTSNTETSQTRETQQLPRVNTVTLAPSDHYLVEREYVGTVQAGQQANLGLELGGKISQLLVDVGDKVIAGDPLIILDKQLLQTQADELRAQQAQITAQLELIEANLKRQKALKKKGFSAESEIDNLNSQRNALRANFRQLAASAAANQLQQQKSTVFAPYDGTISARFVSKGDVVNTGAPTLTLLASTNKEAHIGIPAKQLAKMSEEADWTLRIGNRSYQASLLNPGARVDTGSRTVKLRFGLPQNANVIDGELAYLLFSDIREKPGYWIPLSAMTDGIRGVWNVFALNENNQELRIERRSVQVLYANNDHAFVTGAISNGERLVSDGLHRLVPGQAVMPVKKLPLPLNDTDDEA
ncbi:efflux RND transporter periplasmic adaptor subunit [Photobacterium alginatilyticum]|uniref:Efflux RND transporter periplasmic adaptor subunit n=1 Tax=Photobacterium alginatilyticum TaxID=1775171 RepID=A0ABW9YI39_9GAMM|nr:efflux RND transporter periplasmic adaptor subunit [Photobacterium alginatilyticum]NBI53237.1 efflux RND transporter periplasmic adaptor subunit [Photobacterium alginatilyticum]